MGRAEWTGTNSIFCHRRKIHWEFKCVTEDPLTEEEMDLIRKADKNNRLIKGQVFLWEGANSWEDLWDLDGTKVTGWRPRRRSLKASAMKTRLENLTCLEPKR